LDDFSLLIWKNQRSGVYFRSISNTNSAKSGLDARIIPTIGEFYTFIYHLMNTQTPEPTAIQNFMNSAFVTYGLKILWAIAVILFLLLISKFIAGVVRRNIIKNADEKNKQAEKIW